MGAGLVIAVISVVIAAVSLYIAYDTWIKPSEQDYVDLLVSIEWREETRHGLKATSKSGFESKKIDFEYSTDKNTWKPIDSSYTSKQGSASISWDVPFDAIGTNELWVHVEFDGDREYHKAVSDPLRLVKLQEAVVIGDKKVKPP